MDASLKSAASSPVFTESVAPYLLLDDELTIRAANRAYLRATQRAREELLGRHVFDAFPNNPADASANGVPNLAASLERVLSGGLAHQMPIQRYDVAPTGSDVFITKVWSPVNSPVDDDYGGTVGVLHHVEDVSAVAAIDTAGGDNDPREFAVAESRYRGSQELLIDENARLSDALLVMATSRAGHGGAAFDRRRRLWRALAREAGGRDWRGWSASLCSLAAVTCGTVTGAVISVELAGGRRKVLAASDAQARTFDRIDHALGEGPCRAAGLAGVPVHFSNVSTEHVLWPYYCDAASAAGIVGVSSFPLLLGSGTLGTFTVYRDRWAPDHAEWTDTAILADLAVTTVLADEEHVAQRWPSLDPLREVATVASDISYWLDISFDDAISHLRQHRTLSAVYLREVAAEIVRRRAQ
jgi:hypothetical protein